MGYHGTMDDQIEQQFQQWVKSFADDPATYDHERFIDSLPKDANVKPIYLGRMLDVIFQESNNTLHANQLEAATDELCRTQYIATVKATPELHVRLIQAFIINAHLLYRYGEPGDTRLPALYKHLKDRSLREWTLLYTGSEVPASKRGWFSYITENHGGRAWENLSILYDMNEIETQELAALMPTVFPAMLSEFSSTPGVPASTVPNDISYV